MNDVPFVSFLKSKGNIYKLIIILDSVNTFFSRLIVVKFVSVLNILALKEGFVPDLENVLKILAIATEFHLNHDFYDFERFISHQLFLKLQKLILI